MKNLLIIICLIISNISFAQQCSHENSQKALIKTLQDSITRLNNKVMSYSKIIDMLDSIQEHQYTKIFKLKKKLQFLKKDTNCLNQEDLVIDLRWAGIIEIDSKTRDMSIYLKDIEKIDGVKDAFASQSYSLSIFI